jgi:hypothetical protein
MDENLYTSADELYSGVAVGGPLEGQVIEGRFPDGILFISKPTRRAWLYDYYINLGKFFVRPVGFDALWSEMSEQQKFQVIQETVLSGIDPMRELDMEKARIAAEESSVEVRALPEEVGAEQWQL